MTKKTIGIETSPMNYFSNREIEHFSAAKNDVSWIRCQCILIWFLIDSFIECAK